MFYSGINSSFSTLTFLTNLGMRAGTEPFRLDILGVGIKISSKSFDILIRYEILFCHRKWMFSLFISQDAKVLLQDVCFILHFLEIYVSIYLSIYLSFYLYVYVIYIYIYIYIYMKARLF